MSIFDNEDLRDILIEFLAESRERIDSIEGDLVALEKDPSDLKTIEAIFRTVHTIKGSAGFLDLKILESIAHVSEDILTRAKSGKFLLTPAAVTLLLKALDGIDSIITNLEESGTEGSETYTELKQQLVALNESTGRRTSRLTKKLSSADKPLAGEGETWGMFQGGGGQTPDAATHKTGSLEDILSAATTPIEPNIIVDPKKKAEAPPPPPKVAVPAADDAGEHEVAAAAKSESKGGEPPKVESSIRISVGLLDKLMNLVGELVLARNQLLQYSEQFDDAGFTSVLHRASIVTSELQEQVMKARMQPIGTVFAKFPRVVRDLAIQTGKQIDFKVSGEGTELDRTIHEGIKDPLVHLIRNSCDHGIEKPEVRAAAGKPVKGTVSIAAYHEGGQVIIDIVDDGGGINPDKIKKKAVEKGMLTQSQADMLGDKEACELIFAAGFSTAEQVTNVSGRGVGMDVVKTSIEKIGGQVEIESEVGKGTTIRVRIPLTLAIVPALIVRAGTERFAIPQISLRELVRTEPNTDKHIESVQGSEVFRLRGRLLPLLRLATTLGIPARQTENGVENIVVLSTGVNEMGLVVDEVHDVEEIVVKPLARQLKYLTHFAGSTIMGDGAVALILDVGGLASKVNLDGEAAEQAADAESSSGRGSRDEETQPVLLFSLGANDRFALPLKIVSRLEEFGGHQLERVDGRLMVQYRGGILPIIEAAQYFAVDPVEYAPDDRRSVITFEVDDTSVGILVNEIIDVVDASVDFSRKGSDKQGLLGSTIIEGRTTSLFDTFGLISLDDPKLLRPARKSAKKVVSGTSSGRVLVVDDSQFYRALVEGYLKTAGYAVKSFERPADAITAIQDEEFDLIVSDINMPDIDGLEFMRMVRQLPTGKDIPAIACSTMPKEEMGDQPQQAGFQRYLVKLDHTELIEAVSALVGKWTGTRAT